MFTVDDLIDAIVEQLAPLYAEKPAAGTPNRFSPAPQKKRVFLTELDVKKALTPGGKELTIGRDVIVSPLALEWLELKGIRIIRA